MNLQVWAGRSPLRLVRMRQDDAQMRDEPELKLIDRIPILGSRLTVGRDDSNDVVLDDPYVSRDALCFSRQADGWQVRYHNKHKVEHRRWAQQHQVPLGPGAMESLEVGEHAFIISGGEDRDLTFCLLVSVDEDGPGADPGTAPEEAPGGYEGSYRTPPYREPSGTLGENLERFCEAYLEFLTWPPLRRPKVISDSLVKQETKKDPAYAIARVIKHAVSIGYSLGGAPTARQPDLPDFLARNGVLTFEEHARWRRSV